MQQRSTTGGEAWKTVKALEARGIQVAAREGAVRFSPHAYNDLGEVEKILAAVDELGQNAAVSAALARRPAGLK